MQGSEHVREIEGKSSWEEEETKRRKETKAIVERFEFQKRAAGKAKRKRDLRAFVFKEMNKFSEKTILKVYEILCDFSGNT